MSADLMVEVYRVELDRCRNAFAAPLSLPCRLRLTQLLLNPRPAEWDAAHSIIINRNGLTLWQAVLLVSDGPVVGRVGREWFNIPDRYTLVRALQRAAQEGACAA